MSIKAAIYHLTHYKYDRPVFLQPQIIRLKPAPHAQAWAILKGDEAMNCHAQDSGRRAFLRTLGGGALGLALARGGGAAAAKPLRGVFPIGQPTSSIWNASRTK